MNLSEDTAKGLPFAKDHEVISAAIDGLNSAVAAGQREITT